MSEATPSVECASGSDYKARINDTPACRCKKVSGI
jgi:hypothetical protein